MGGEFPLVEVRRLRKHFFLRRSLLAKLLAGERDRTVRAVDGVDLQIHQGETLGLVGESGCGKTTLGRTILRLCEPTEGETLFAGRPVSLRDGRSVMEFRRRAQVIFQNPYASLNPRKTVRDILGVPLSRRGVRNPVEREAEIIALLRKVGLNDRHVNHYPHQFSGGQRQRIGIARALAMRPEFVVADEPVSSLDVSVQAQIINLLEDLKEEFGLTYLFIAHDLSVIYYVSDRVAVMYLGKIVEVARTEELFDSPAHPYTRALLSAIPTTDRAARRQRLILQGGVPSPIDPPAGCRFHPRCAQRKGNTCATEEPPLTDVGGGHVVACHRHR